MLYRSIRLMLLVSGTVALAATTSNANAAAAAGSDPVAALKTAHSDYDKKDAALNAAEKVLAPLKQAKAKTATLVKKYQKKVDDLKKKLSTTAPGTPALATLSADLTAAESDRVNETNQDNAAALALIAPQANVMQAQKDRAAALKKLLTAVKNLLNNPPAAPATPAAPPCCPPVPPCCCYPEPPPYCYPIWTPNGTPCDVPCWAGT
jgi:Zn-dependent oligopeptidase